MPRADRCKKKREEKLRNAASNVRKITAFTLNTADLHSQTTDSHLECNTPPVKQISTSGPSETSSPEKYQSTLKPAENSCNDDFCETTNSIPPITVPFSNTKPLGQMDTETESLLNCPKITPATAVTSLPQLPMETEAEDANMFLCTALCCIQASPFVPTVAQLQETSVKQAHGQGGGKRIQKCPLSIFSKYTWVTYFYDHGSNSLLLL